jgi:mono/diheme cytochrome c family protein
MSEDFQRETQPDPAVAADAGMMDAHEQALRCRADGGSRFRGLPIAIIAPLGALILFSLTYLSRYAGDYSPLIFDETAKPSKGGLVFKVDPVILGKKYYKTECVACHRSQGEGVPAIYPPLAGSEWVNGPAGRVIRIVLYGLKGKLHVQGNEFGASQMPVFGRVQNSAHNWSDQKIAAVLTYIRQDWGNKADPISEEDVAAVRNALGNRESMTEAELEQLK